MPRLRLTGAQTLTALQKAGFAVVRVKGSHHLLRHPDGRTTVVPFHAGELLGPGLLAKTLRDTGLARDDLVV